MRKQRGFTLIELLVVVAIIGLLSSIVSAALNVQRMRARDARRVSDIKQVKSGLDIYYANGSGYPSAADWTGHVGQILQCAGTNAFQVPRDPRSPYVYTYRADTLSGNVQTTGCAGSGYSGVVWKEFELEFYIEGKAKWFIMNTDGNLRERDTGTPASYNDLLN